MLTEKKPVPRWFIVTAALAVVWNLLGVAAFVMQISMTPEMIAELPEAQQALLESMPQWVLIAFAIATYLCLCNTPTSILNPCALPLQLLVCTYPMYVCIPWLIPTLY